MIKRIDRGKIILKKSSTAKVGKHIPCGYSISTGWPFDGIENKYDVYRGVDYTNEQMIKLIRLH